MAKKSLLVFIEPCCNELVYLKNQLPQLLEVADKIILVDDFSEDGTKEWIELLNNPKIQFIQHEFECCAKQFDFALQEAPKDNTWVFNITPVELPTIYFFDNIRLILDDMDTRNVDRLFMSVFHLRTERTICQEIGGEMRIFRNDEHHQAKFTGYPHESIDGRFDGHCVAQVDEKFAFVRFRQADPNKIKEWLTKYVEKGLYSLWDLNRRLNYPSVPLPMFIRYKISDGLRRYLDWTN